jgi:hypothetical protein
MVQSEIPADEGHTNRETSLPHHMKQRYLVLRLLLSAARRYAWCSLKNCIEVLKGRNTRTDENGRFLRQYVLHLTGLRVIRKITCTGLGKSEGAGSQALMIMNAINFARSFGLTYVHTPFRLIQHAERPMEEWVTAWETLFNLGAGEATCDKERDEIVDFSHHFNDLDHCFGWRCRWDELAERFKALIPEFRRKYYLNNSRCTTDEVTVAVHIRRGDVCADDPDYFTGDEVILRTIASVKSTLDTHRMKYRIRVYSQGDIADFTYLSSLGVEFFLDVDAIWTMQELIAADVLVMAKGCFSYCAALISDGIKIFEPMAPFDSDLHDLLPGWKWRSHSAKKSWVRCSADGSFDCAIFERQLLLVVRDKRRTSEFRYPGSKELW